ncbi:PEGA domain-containing protein [Poriferisphaera sp. WC338]|uniref:PEGA domain-containing protein n=1 Tax=Poriferisphaera sp. WC338 TaxID=3425129 RepID=UPI003D81C2A7
MKNRSGVLTFIMVLTAVLLVMPNMVSAEPQATQKQVREKTTTIRETTTTITETVEEKKAPARIVAIFIKNRAGKSFESKIGMFEDLLVGEIADLGFKIISPEDTAKMMKTYPGTKDGKPIEPTMLDKHLTEKSNALRLAQTLNADYLFTASILSYGHTTKKINRPDLGISSNVTDYTLRIMYKILDGNDGKSLSAGNMKSSKRLQQTAELQTETSDMLNVLMDDAVVALAAKLNDKGAAASVETVKKNSGLAMIAINPSIQGFNVPEITVDANGQYNVGQKILPLQAIDVDVELDGVVIGTAPGELQASPGLHTISVSHPNFEPWERMINVRDGMKLKIPMVMTDDARSKFTGMTAFIASLKNTQQLTDAQVEVLRGHAQMLRQSGFRVDHRVDAKADHKSDHKSDVTVDRKVDIEKKIDKKADVKVDTDQALTVIQNNIERQNTAQSAWPE